MFGAGRRLILSGLLVLTVLVVPAVVAAAAETNVLRFNFPIEGSLESPCFEDEIVEVSGRGHIVLHLTRDDAGGFHLLEHTNLHVSGVGTSGVKYQGNGVKNLSFNAQPSFPVEFTLVSNFLFVGQGPGNDLYFHIKRHYTVNANGEVTAAFGNISVECK